MKKNSYIYIGLMLALILASFAWIHFDTQKAKAKVYLENKMGPIHITKAEFLKKVDNFEASPTEWKYLGDKPCIVDFYATWCGPCKAIAPILDELAAKYKGQIYIYEVDVDAEPELANAFGIQSIPTLFFCPMKGDRQIMQGGMPKEAFENAITEILLKK